MGRLAVIFGESHNANSMNYIRKTLTMLKSMGLVDVWLQENAYNYVLDTGSKIKKKLRNKDWMVGQLGIGGEMYELALELDLPVIGIDLHPTDPRHRAELVESFRVREDRMVNVFEEYRRTNNVFLTVGDTHLRTPRTKQLGRASPLWTRYHNNKNVFIVRSDDREIDDDYPEGTFSYERFIGLISQPGFSESYLKTNREKNLFNW